MYCPTCGQKQAAENVRFCSACGFSLIGVHELIANNGSVGNNADKSFEPIKDSPRKRGIKQGAMIMLFGMLLIVPLLAMLHLATKTEPFFAAIAAIISFFGGILRIIYAIMFESKFPNEKTLEEKIINSVKNLRGNKQNQQSLPSAQSIPVSDYISPIMGNWRTTNDLVQPNSIIDNTTKLFEKEEN